MQVTSYIGDIKVSNSGDSSEMEPGHRPECFKGRLLRFLSRRGTAGRQVAAVL